MSILYTKNSKFLKPIKLSQEQFSSMQYGDTVEIDQKLSSSVEMIFIPDNKIGIERGELVYLENTLKNYKLYSEKYDPSYYSYGTDVRMIKIPSIYFGSSIQKESIKLELYITGTLAARLEDVGGTGELKETYPFNEDGYKTAGVVLYNHGIFLLTGNWDATTTMDYYEYEETAPSVYSWVKNRFRWIFFGTGSDQTVSSSFNLEFKGTEIKPVLTLNLPLEKGQANFSNNPTSYPNSLSISTNMYYKENEYITPHNIVSSSYTNTTASYEKQTYITKIALYDKDKNVIGYAKLSKPLLKTENREYNFKLKLDL